MSWIAHTFLPEWWHASPDGRRLRARMDKDEKERAEFESWLDSREHVEVVSDPDGYWNDYIKRHNESLRDSNGTQSKSGK